MKYFILALFTGITSAAAAQQIDSIYVNLYTDSLKKGTFNYINIDGLLHNGRYLPLDTTHIRFEASAGVFYGNSLFIPPDFTGEKVHITATLKKNPSLHQSFDIHIKQKPDGPLKTLDQLLNEMDNDRKKKKSKG